MVERGGGKGVNKLEGESVCVGGERLGRKKLGGRVGAITFCGPRGSDVGPWTYLEPPPRRSNDTPRQCTRIGRREVVPCR